MLNLKCTMSSLLMSKAPTIILPNLKSSYSYIYISKFVISKSYSSFLCVFNPNYNNITLSDLKFNYFLSRPITVDTDEIVKCENGIDRIEHTEKEYELRLRNSIFKGCHTGFQNTNKRVCCGGAIIIRCDYDVNIIDSQFEECSCSLQGGAIMIYHAGKVDIRSSLFKKCYISNCNGNSDQCSNIKGAYGAAMFISNIPSFTAYNATFIDNEVLHKTFKPSGQNDMKATILFMNCLYVLIDHSTFNNIETVKCDLLFSFYTEDREKDYFNKEVTIQYNCFYTKVDVTIDIDINNQRPFENNLVAKFVCKKNNFYSKSLDENFDEVPIKELKTDPNFNQQSFCQLTFSFTPSNRFTASSSFTPSKTFTPSNAFSKSMLFTVSQAFSPSNELTQSDMFGKTDYFTKSEYFSCSTIFSRSTDFTFSDFFSRSNDFSTSEMFSGSNMYSPSYAFSNTMEFSLTNGFSTSDAFSISDIFTSSSTPGPTQNEEVSFFSFSDNFTDFIIIDQKGASKLPKGGIIGIIIACLVLLAIIILLIILFLRRKKSAFIPPEDDPMNIDGLEIPVNMYD